MLKRSDTGVLGASWLAGHGGSEGSEAPGVSSRVQRAASSLQMQPEERVLASCGAAKAAPLTMLKRYLLRAPLGATPVVEQLGHTRLVAHLLGEGALVALQLGAQGLRCHLLLVQLCVARRQLALGLL